MRTIKRHETPMEIVVTIGHDPLGNDDRTRLSFYVRMADMKIGTSVGSSWPRESADGLSQAAQGVVLGWLSGVTPQKLAFDLKVANRLWTPAPDGSLPTR